MELITYTLNEKLNRKDQNIVKFISRIDCKLHTTSIRIIASNKTSNTTILRDLKDEGVAPDPTRVVLGMQTIIESITFSNTLIKKPMELKSSSGQPTVWVWDFRDGNGQIRCILAGYLYQDLKLIDFDASAMAAYKRSVWDNSMDNPRVFNTFFGLNEDLYLGSPGIFLGEEHGRSLFDHEKLKLEVESVSEQVDKDLGEYLTPNLLALCHKETLRFVFSVRQPSIHRLGLSSAQLQERLFKFDQFEVFFSTELIDYEQSKTYSLSDGSFTGKFQHFVTLFGSKITFVYSVFQVIKTLLQVEETQNANRAKAIINKVGEREKSKAQFKDDQKSPKDAPGTPNDKNQQSMKQDHQSSAGKKTIMTDGKEIDEETEVIAKTNVEYPCGILIDKPQFNFNNYLNFNQTIFTSKQQCLLRLESETLEFDHFSIDPRYMFKMVFRDLELYNIDRANIRTVSDIHWITDYARIDPSIFETVLKTDRAVFTKVFCRLDESVIDFSKPLDMSAEAIDRRLKEKVNVFKWGTSTRDDSFTIDVGNFESGMDSKNYSNFVAMVNFIIDVFVKNKSKEDSQKEVNDLKNEHLKNKNMLSELKEQGKEGLIKHVEQQIRTKEAIFTQNQSRASIFEVNLGKVALKLLKDGKAHYALSITSFQKKDVFETSGRNEVTYRVGRLSVTHLQAEGNQTQELLRRSSEKSAADDMIYSNMQYFYVDGQMPVNKWLVVKNFEIYVAPIIIKLSQDVYTFMTEFFFNQKQAAAALPPPPPPKDSPKDAMLQNPELFYKMNKMSLQDHKKVIEADSKQEDPHERPNIDPAPSYFKKIRIHKLNLCLTVKTDSFFTSFENMMLSLDDLEKYNKLYSNMEVVDKLKWKLIKTALSSVAKYKLLGIKGSLEDLETSTPPPGAKRSSSPKK